MPCFYGTQPRPDSSELHHPPPSPANCGTAETVEIFRAVGGVLQESGGTRDALEGLNWPHFRFFVSNLDFPSATFAPKGGSGSLTGPCSVGKEAARGVQNQGQGYRGVAG